MHQGNSVTFAWLKFYRTFLLLLALTAEFYFDNTQQYLTIILVGILGYGFLEVVKYLDIKFVYRLEQFLLLIVDIILISTVVHSTGGYLSSFKFLYVIEFVQIGYLYGFRETLAVGMFSSFAVLVISYFDNSLIIAILHAMTNFLTALVVGFLARKRQLVFFGSKRSTKISQKQQNFEKKSQVLDSITKLASAMAEVTDIKQIVEFLDGYTHHISDADKAIFILPGEDYPVVYYKDFLKDREYNRLNSEKHKLHPQFIYNSELFSLDKPKNIVDVEHEQHFHNWVAMVSDIPQIKNFIKSFRSFMVLPIRHGHEVFGHVIIANCQHIRAFSSEQLELASILTNALAVYLKKIDSAGKLEKKYDEFVQMAAKMVDLKDPYTHNHSRRVAAFARDIGYAMGLDDNSLKKLVAAGLLHDVGKIGIPDAILNKPDKLTNEEFSIIKHHPLKGSELLKRVTGMEEVAVWVSQHHERVDGRGYPKGLKGEEISLEAKIIAVADAFEAMTSDRAYRTRMPTDAALKELQFSIDSQFDKRAVDAFAKVLDREKQVLTGDNSAN